MKLALYSTASAVALIVSMGPALADPDFSGVGQLYLGGGTADGSFFAGKFLDDPFLYGGKAQGFWTLSPDLHFQVDLFAQHTDDLIREGGELSQESDSERFGGAIHLVHPFEKRARFGVAGSIWSTDVYSFDGGEFAVARTDATYGLAALEAQFFGDEWSMIGQAGVFKTISCSAFSGSCPGVTQDGTYIRGKIRYFLHENTSVSLEGMQMWGNVDDDLFGGKNLLARSSLWTLEAEHRFQDSQFAGFVTLTHENDEVESLFASSANTQSVSIGVKFYLDQPSVKENDKSGAAFDTPQFGNALENSGALSLLGISL